MVDVTVTYPELSNPATSGSFPKTALQELRVGPIPRLVAKKLLEREHYLQSLPGDTQDPTLGIGRQLVGEPQPGQGKAVRWLSPRYQLVGVGGTHAKGHYPQQPRLQENPEG